jgi:hypothetical protein
LERSGVDLNVEVAFEPSNDRVIIDLEPSKDSFNRGIVDFEKSATSFVPSNMKVPAVEVFTKSGEREAGLVRAVAVVIVIEDEVLMDVTALKEDGFKYIATEYKLLEVLAVEGIDGEGSRPSFVSPTRRAADSPSPEEILDSVSGFLGHGNAPKLGGGGSSSQGGGLFEANACL